MKTKRTEVRSQKSEVRTLTPGGFAPTSDLRPLTSERGVALVITLILLSVTLVMAVAFLAISRRERNAVTTTTDTAGARLAAEAALASAEAQIVANIFATTNVAACNFGLLVSTNYINGFGFNPNPAPGSANPTNVNYDHTLAGNPLTADQLIQNIANLFYLPRVPVYTTNLVFSTNENRFYLDLNRNGRDEPNGAVPMIGHNGGFLHPDGTEDNNPVNVVTNSQVGDPEWIGMLDHPDAPHGPNNRFVSRYAFIAVPAGNTLDINAIHNQVFDENSAINSNVNPPPNGDNYFRNQGVGSWEINLAAFLADLNTNEWGKIIDLPSPPPFGGPVGGSGYYQYNRPFDIGTANQGRAFDDARALLAYRYANNYLLLASVDNLYGGALGSGHFAFLNDNIDGYSDGPLQTTFNTNQFLFEDNPRLPWAGADNTNQFYTLQEFFDPAKVGIPFVTNIWSTGTSNATYDRYTYYRMLDQLGSDSAPESDKINLNYSNAVVNYGSDSFSGSVYPTNIAIISGAETNFVSWPTNDFFIVAADRLLRTYTALWATNYVTNSFGELFPTNSPNTNYVATFNVTNSFGITNIPVWVSNRFVYTPAVNRLLQLAANIYDATTTNYYPTVFRPLFSRDQNGLGTNLFVSGYTNVPSVTGLFDPRFAAPVNVWDLANPSVFSGPVLNAPMNVYGVPWIIGAKKGFPNFNEFYMESAFKLTRKIVVTRSDTNVTLSTIFNNYEMFDLSVSNHFGVECWNSYRSNYTGSPFIYITNALTITLTNDEQSSGQYFSYTTNLSTDGLLQFPNTSETVWPGYNSVAAPLSAPLSFQTNFSLAPYGTIPTNFASIPDSLYRFNQPGDVEDPGHTGFYLTTNLALPFEAHIASAGYGQYPQPHWGLTMTNNLRVIMADGPLNGPYHVIDYVQLGGPYSTRDLTSEIVNGYNTMGTGIDTRYNNQWNTNIINGVPTGITEQLDVSEGLGNPTYSTSKWGRDEKTAYDQMNGFLVFLNGANTPLLTPADLPGYVPDPTQMGIAETTNAMQAPYTPTAIVVQDITWQANDPLVHYTASDLINPAAGNGLQIYLNWPGNLGQLNDRYMPWGGNPLKPGTDTNAYTLAIKDPRVYTSDDWNFPTNKFPTVGWLGRVHRGTPWQTIYLKSSDVLTANGSIGTNIWIDRTGDVNPYDAANSAPKKDWLLFDLFTTAFNDNATRGQLSVNVAADNPDPAASLAAWSALFSGIVVPTTLTNTYTIIAPAGPLGASTNSPLGQIVQGIYNTRTNFSNPDGVKGAFEHAGYILSVPQLTTQSPFLAWTNAVQRQGGISDEMYEWLPQQVMSLLRAGPPRYVIYCYGQALKPAPNSLVTSGGNTFGMCTNYQVVAESAVRAVVRVEGAGTPTPHIVVESYNPLPPD